MRRLLPSGAPVPRKVAGILDEPSSAIWPSLHALAIASRPVFAAPMGIAIAVMHRPATVVRNAIVPALVVGRAVAETMLTGRGVAADVLIGRSIPVTVAVMRTGRTRWPIVAIAIVAIAVAG